MAEWECQALVDEAKQEAVKEAKPRKVIFNRRDDVWDFRSDLELPWLSKNGAGDKGKTGDLGSDSNPDVISVTNTFLDSSKRNANKETSFYKKDFNFHKEFV